MRSTGGEGWHWNLLKATLLLTRVDMVIGLQTLMKDLVTPVPVEEINAVVKKCLEKAALINYTKMSEAAKIEGSSTLCFLRLISTS